MRFSPTTAARPGESDKQVKIAGQILRKYGFEYMAELIVGWRDVRHNIDIFFDRSRPEAMKKAYNCYDELLSSFGRNGWGISRANIAFMDKTADIYGPSMRRLNRSIKRALDPNNILSPGKSGISLS
jgi:4-cresol dehydrogenase (hydroxylating)